MGRKKETMKVLCIKTGQWVGVLSGTIFDGPKYGEIVTVVGDGYCGHFPTYDILEYPDDAGWNKEWFIPISSIDETTFERNYQKELV